MGIKKRKLSEIPSVDKLLKSSYGAGWLESYPRITVLHAIREVIDKKRKEILKGSDPEISIEAVSRDIQARINELFSYKLRPLINATGVVIHTNLGRSILSDRAIENITRVAESYSNLEYELSQGKRGKRYSHLRYILKELSGAEDAIVVNNNAAAVLLCLNTFAKDREAVVSRGELVEIGGSFRIPEVMKSSGALLREVGSTNKTHLADYEDALCGNTALLLKVHTSNYKVIGFTEEVTIEDIVWLGKDYRIPVMADLGSGCMIDFEKFGIQGEPTVQSVIKAGVDIVTFSGDKLLGGPQAGLILGRKKYIQKIQKNPMLRAMRIDKLTLASLEATLMQYLDGEEAVKTIPTLRALTQPENIIRKRARKISSSLQKIISSHTDIEVIADRSRAGGGSMPDTDFNTYVVSIRPRNTSVNTIEKRLRESDPPVIVRIKEDALLIDARTVLDREVKTLINSVASAFSE
jgi:L-seryl-tRNA(Ser) seleniumtransferase